MEGQDPGLKSLHDLAGKAVEQIIGGQFSSSGFKLSYHYIKIYIPEIRIWEFLEAGGLRHVISRVLNFSPGGSFLSKISKRVCSDIFHRHNFSFAMQWAPEFEQRGFLTYTTLGSLGIDPDLDANSVRVTWSMDDVYVGLDKMVCCCWLVEFHPLIVPLKPSPDRSSWHISKQEEFLKQLCDQVRVVPEKIIPIIRLEGLEPVAVHERVRGTLCIMGFDSGRVSHLRHRLPAASMC